MIAVTGLMRSGTSPLAMILHQLGVPMGEYMRFPMNNKYSHLEYEDAILADALCNEIVNGKDPEKPGRIINDYIAYRKEKARGKPWGVKTPYLLPFTDELRDACRVLDESLVLIVTDRPFSETVDSIRRQVSHLSEFEKGEVLPRVLGLQDKLAEHWLHASEDAEIFKISETREGPRAAARRLAALANVESDIDLAIRGIREGGMRWLS